MELKWLVWYESKSWQSFVGSVGFSLFFFLHKSINAESIICLLAAVQVVLKQIFVGTGGMEWKLCGYDMKWLV